MVRQGIDKPLVVFCLCGFTQLVPQAKTRRITRAVARCGGDHEIVRDLCGLAASKDASLALWAARKNLTIVACFPRAVRWLFHAAGVTLSENVRIINARTAGAGEVAAALGPGGGQNDRSKFAPPPEGSWVPWFPVIDYDSCESCGKCLDFCLFGVYALSEKQGVEVRHPANCKTNCPACARVCPNTAIIFPKYRDGPVAGDEGGTGQTAEPLKVDLSTVARKDVLEFIRKRSANAAGRESAEKA